VHAPSSCTFRAARNVHGT